MKERGFIHAVRRVMAGSVISQDAGVGETTIYVEDAIDFDEEGGTLEIDGDEYTYASCDIDESIIELAEPLQAPIEQGYLVQLVPYVEEIQALVLIGDSDEALTARIPHSLNALIPEGVREEGYREGVEVELHPEDGEDEWIVTDVFGKAAIVEGMAIDVDGLAPVPAVRETTDGFPPNYSPTPQVTGGYGSLFVQFESVGNADPAYYKVYMSDASPVPIDEAHLIDDKAAPFLFVQAMPDGTPLVVEKPYYFVVVAYDADGEAAPGAEGSGAPIAGFDQAEIDALNADLDTLDTELAQVKTDLAGQQAQIDTVETSANGKTKVYYQATAPSAVSNTLVYGDLWFQTSNGYAMSMWNGTAWVSVRDAAITKAQVKADDAWIAAQDARAYADGKVVTYYQADMPAGDALNDGDLWYDINDNNRMYRYFKDKSGGRENLVANPSFETGITGWTARGLATVARDATQGYHGTSSLKVTIPTASTGTGSHGVQSPTLPVEPNAEYSFSVWIKRPTASPDNAWTFWVEQYDSAWNYKGAGTVSVSTTQTYADWTRRTTTITTGANTTRVLVDFRTDYPIGAESIWFDGVMFEKGATPSDEFYEGALGDSSAWVDVRDGSIAEAQQAATEAEQLAARKITTFYENLAPTAEAVGDLWIDTDNGNKLHRWDGTAWVSVRDAEIANVAASADNAYSKAMEAMTAAEQAQATADGQVSTYYQETPPWPDGDPNHATTDIGDMWYRSSDNASFRWDGDSWNVITDTQAAEALAAAQNAQATADGKITAFYQASEPLNAAIGDLWYDTDNGNKPYYCATVDPVAWISVRDTMVNEALETANGKNKVIYSANPASGTTGYKAGDTWFQRNTTGVIIGQWEFDGNQWVSKSIGNEVIAYIDAAKITTGVLDANRINTNLIVIGQSQVTGLSETLSNTATMDTVNQQYLPIKETVEAWQYTPGETPPSGTTTIHGGLIQTDTIGADQIIAGAIYSEHIATAGLDAGKITFGEMAGDRIKANSLNATKIVAGSITGDKIAANTIYGDRIVANSIGADKIAANAITASELSVYALTADHLLTNNVLANAITAGSMTSAVMTGSTIQTRTGSYGVIRMDGGNNTFAAYDSSGGRMFYINGNTGYVEMNGVIKTAQYGQRIEMGNTGPNDPADEIRWFNSNTTISLRNMTDYPGTAYFSIQRSNNTLSTSCGIYPANDGHLVVGRGHRGGNGAKIKFLTGNDGVQIRTALDDGYAPIRASAFNTSSYAKFKKNIESVSVRNTAEILKGNGLRKWEWAWDDAVPEFDDVTGKPTGALMKTAVEEREGMGLMADDLPEFLQTGDGYSLTAVVGFLWDALRESNDRIEELEAMLTTKGKK